VSFCEECFLKQRQIDRLFEEVKRLKQKLRYEERKTKEGYFGSATPSAKKAVKENSAHQEQKKRGGAKIGHKGYGRSSISEEEADQVEYLVVGDICPDCGNNLAGKEIVDRSVIDSVPVKAKKVLYKCEKKWCAHCRKTITKKPPVLPKSLYGNQLVAQAASMHYGHGVPIGRVEAILGDNLPSGSLFDVFHRLANLWKPAIAEIIEEYRRAPVKHADETGWRTDGRSGFAWLFCSERISLFQCKDTRSAKVPLAIFGREQLPGVLVVDRYQGYNRVRIKIQYCYAHLLRKVEDLGKQFIDEVEVQCFVGTFAPLLSKAMHLRTTSISDKIYYVKARLLKEKIVKVVDSPSKHLGIKEIQLIFKENKDRLYHWVCDRGVPAENNRAERELRPTVIARKVSFGSQSEKGAQTRSILMTIF
jgi:transposase